MSGKAKPLWMHFPVTYQCNCRCVMCTIWQRPQGAPQISLEKLGELLSEDILSLSLETVILTGGESTLRPDLPKLVEVIVRHCSRLRTISISTNGMDSIRVLHCVKETLRTIPSEISLGVNLSLDGIGKTHDTVRGVPNTYDNVVRTMRTLQELQQRSPNFSFWFDSTLSAFNYHEARKIYAFACEEGVPISFSPIVLMDVYINSVACSPEVRLQDHHLAELKTFFQWLYQRAPTPYNWMIPKMLDGKKRSIGCLARDHAFFLDVDGSVYRCSQSSRLKMGNIYQSSFSDIWCGDGANQVKGILTEVCARCYSNCFPEYETNLSRFIKSILRKRIPESWRKFACKGWHRLRKI